MPISIDIRENRVLGPPYERGLQDGESNGHAEGQRRLLQSLIQRSGELSQWAATALAEITVDGDESVTVRPISFTLLDEVRGRVYEDGYEQGFCEGLRLGMRITLRRCMEHSFGPLPVWTDRVLEFLSTEQLENLSDSLFS